MSIFARIGGWFKTAWFWVVGALSALVGLLFWLWSREKRMRRRAEAQRDAEQAAAEANKERLEDESRIRLEEEKLADETIAKVKKIQDEADEIEDQAMELERETRKKGAEEGGAGAALNDAFGLDSSS